MNRAIRLVSAVVITLLLSFSGYIGTAMLMDDLHSTSMQHADMSCLSQCLAGMSHGPVLPLLQYTLQIFAVAVLFVATIRLVLLATPSLEAYGLRPRPSPNLNQLFERYII